jgi:hypothetical protein
MSFWDTPQTGFGLAPEQVAVGPKLGILGAFERAYKETTQLNSQYGAEMMLRDLEQANRKKIFDAGLVPPPSLEPEEGDTVPKDRIQNPFAHFSTSYYTGIPDPTFGERALSVAEAAAGGALFRAGGEAIGAGARGARRWFGNEPHDPAPPLPEPPVRPPEAPPEAPRPLPIDVPPALEMAIRAAGDDPLAATRLGRGRVCRNRRILRQKCSIRRTTLTISQSMSWRAKPIRKCFVFTISSSRNARISNVRLTNLTGFASWSLA